MTKKELKDILFGRLDSFLRSKGFKYTKSRDEFRRLTPYGFDQISIGITDYKIKFYLNFYLSLRHNKVSDISTAFSLMDPNEKKNAYTIVLPQGKIMNKPNFKYIITNEGELNEAITDIEKFINEYAWPFFEQFSDIKALNQFINHEDAETFTQYAQGRSFNGIVLAKLTGDKDFEQIIEKYKAALSDMWDEFKSKMDELIVYLKNSHL